MSTPLQLYIHIPFCVHRCHYCDFNSHVRENPPWDAYQKALQQELAHWADQPSYQGRTLDTIFIGGGTPSLAPPRLIAAILADAKHMFTFSERIEVSLECNPGTMDQQHLHGYAEAGVNRLSIGAQSFQAHELQWMERIHSMEQIKQTIAAARHAGIANIGLDLIYGLPRQDLETWKHTLAQAIAQQVQHLSCYQLTVEPHTKLAKQHALAPYHLPDETLGLQFLAQTQSMLAEHGYLSYEISNYAQPGFHCRHNDGYWRYHDYIGIGAGAAGKWDIASAGTQRYNNIRSPESYMQAVQTHGHAIHQQESLPHAQAVGEAIWLGLRRHQGIPLLAFQQRFGQHPGFWHSSVIEAWQASGHLEEHDQHLRLTASGLPLADRIAEDFLLI